MYSLLEYRSSYSETTGSLWFYSKKKQLTLTMILQIPMILDLSSIEADKAKVTLKNTAIAVSLKYLNNFRRSIEMPLIN